MTFQSTRAAVPPSQNQPFCQGSYKDRSHNGRFGVLRSLTCAYCWHCHHRLHQHVWVIIDEDPCDNHYYGCKDHSSINWLPSSDFLLLPTREKLPKQECSRLKEPRSERKSEDWRKRKRKRRRRQQALWRKWSHLLRRSHARALLRKYTRRRWLFSVFEIIFRNIFISRCSLSRGSSPTSSLCQRRTWDSTYDQGTGSRGCDLAQRELPIHGGEEDVDSLVSPHC